MLNQRKGSTNNTQVGHDFETKAQAFFAQSGLILTPRFRLEIGINGKKPHNFDLGNEEKKVIIECKDHTWTESNNLPSAKMTTWDQAMYFFYATPSCGYRKIFFIRRDYSQERRETLGQYYLRTHSHLIPIDVEIWEYDQDYATAIKIN